MKAVFAWFGRSLRPLGHLVSRYPLVFVPAAALMLLLWGGSPDGFDAFHVVWADAPSVAFVAGLAAAAFFGAVVILVHALDRQFEPPATDEKKAPSYRGAWILLCVAAVLPAVVRGDLFPVEGVAQPDGREQKAQLQFLLAGVHQTRFWLPAGVAFALLVGVGYARWVIRHKGNDPEKVAKREWRFGWAALCVVAVGYVVMCVCHWALPEFYLPRVPAAVTAILLLGLLTAVAAGVHWLGSGRWKRFFYPAVFALLVALVLGGGYLEVEHRVPGLDDYYSGARQKPDLGQYAEYRKGPTTLANDPDALRAWRDRRTKNGEKSGPVVVVSVSGGASTSAVFVARALFRLELRFPGFVDRVRIITGASGGMLGAAYFVSQMLPGSPYREDERRKADGEPGRLFRAYADRLARGEPAPPDDPDEKKYQELSDQLEDEYIKGLTDDFLSPLFQKWVHKDMNPLAWVYPRATTNDRGAALEYAWDRSLKGGPDPAAKGLGAWLPNAPSLGFPFDRLRELERDGRIPSLVFTPMLVEDGRQLIISNLDLDYMTTWGSYAPPEDPFAPLDRPMYSAAEFYRLFPAAEGKFKLGTAVRLNASFPLLSPATELPTVPPRRVVDAGYYDNYGQIIAARWLERHTPFLEQTDTPVWFLQLWTYGYEDRSTSLDLPPASESGGALRSNTAPLTGLFSAWRANMAYRGEERLNMLMFDRNLARFQAKPHRRDPIAYRIRKDIGSANLPMNWVLTSYNLVKIEKETDVSIDLVTRVAEVVAESAKSNAPLRQDDITRAVEKVSELNKRSEAAKQSAKEQAEFFAELYKVPRPKK